MTYTTLITLPELTAKLRIGRTKLRELRSQPGFPTPVRACQRPLAWRLHDIEAWLADQ